MNIEQIKNKIKEIIARINFLKKLQELLRWKERIEMEIMIRVAARQEGLTRAWEEVLLAVIKCESNLNPKAINKNRDGTTDYGLCQYNDYWYKDVITPEEALNNPEKAVRIMCRQFKKGRASSKVFTKNMKGLGSPPSFICSFCRIIKW